MDRDPKENVLDPVEPVSPSTGENGTGDVGDEAARIHRRRQDNGAEPKPAEPSNPEQAPGRQDSL